MYESLAAVKKKQESDLERFNKIPQESALKTVPDSVQKQNVNDEKANNTNNDNSSEAIKNWVLEQLKKYELIRSGDNKIEPTTENKSNASSPTSVFADPSNFTFIPHQTANGKTPVVERRAVSADSTTKPNQGLNLVHSANSLSVSRVEVLKLN